MGRALGSKHIYTIAEIACNHEGDVAYLESLILAIADSGADAVKFQIYLADEILEKTHPDYNDLFICQLTKKQWTEAIDLADKAGLDVWVDLSSAYGQSVVTENIDKIKGVKLHASDTQNIFSIEFIKANDFDVIISCGGTTLVELFRLIDQINHGQRIILMHGFQAYPTVIEDCHLNRIKTMSQIFPFPIGIADHVDGSDPFARWLPLVAVGAGATVIEKHITMNRAEKRDDYFSALEPHEFREMVACLESSYIACGNSQYDFCANESAYRQKMKKTVVPVRAVPKDRRLEPDDVRLIVRTVPQPANSVYKVMGSPLNRSVEAGQSISHADVENRTVIFVNARSASSRLPAKALLPFYREHNTIEYLLQRLKSYPNLPGKIVFATTDQKEDDALEECAKKVGVACVRGDNLDVMKRMIQVGEYGNFDTLVRVTGDSTLISAEYIVTLLDHHFSNNLEYTRLRGLPIGMEAEVIDLSTLKLIHNSVIDKNRTEFLTWFLDTDGICNNGLLTVLPEKNWEQFRLTLDYQQDLDLMKRIAEELHSRHEEFYIKTDDILMWLEDNQPEWREQEELWTFSRSDINTGLKYNPVRGI